MTDINSFVIFAGMRTGSNLLEATLNRIKRVTCFGEAFNPYMLGWPDTDQIRDVTMPKREADPHLLLNAITSREGHLSGFRYFHDHDPRVFDAIMSNRRCAKIVLTRNPTDSYVSTELARLTNQWKLNQTETPIPATVDYDGEAFRQMLSQVQEFQGRVLHGLQTSGQSAFWLNYDDLRDSDVMTGLLHFLGRTDIETVNPASDQVPQNPREMSGKVNNIEAMRADLNGLDPFALSRIPTFEPRRGPVVPSFVASNGGDGALFLPVSGGPSDTVLDWLSQTGPLVRDFSQNTLRNWQKEHPGHRSFTVLRHPLKRAWAAFGQLISAEKPELRQQLRDIHRVTLPPDDLLGAMSDDEAARVFHEFLDFLRRNLNGQTSLPVAPIWASQTAVIAGFSRFLIPDMVLREADLTRDLGWLTKAAHLSKIPASDPMPLPEILSDKTLQQAARSAYLRDYLQFGFANEP